MTVISSFANPDKFTKAIAQKDGAMLNPIISMEIGQGCYMADARISLAPVIY
ncbi:MAG: hypothetical protein NTZ34_10285 [Chloroflexi bacterium]|nr:hypothetical protein [Chloroflexota bacterium]